MPDHTATPVTAPAELQGQHDRRHGDRAPTLFSLFYSGMDHGQLLISDGIVTNLSPDGACIHGNRLVTPGMTIALFVELPGIGKPLCVAQSRVSWVAGRRFGVELGSLNLEQKDLLRVLFWNRTTRLDHGRWI